jgi:hypothetical protein
MSDETPAQARGLGDVDYAQLRWAASIQVYCSMDVPVVRNNLFVLGSPSLVAAALVGRAAGTAIGHARARRMAAPQWRSVGQGEVYLDATGMRVRWDGTDITVPYRTITGWQVIPQGLQIERVAWAALAVQVHDPGSFQQWFARLAEGQTWQPPTLTTLEASQEVVGLCQDDPRFTFGLPAGFAPSDPQWLAGKQQQSPGRIVASVNQLIGDDVGVCFWVMEMPLSLFSADEVSPQTVVEKPEEVAAAMAYAGGTPFTDPVELVTLGGERASTFHLSFVGPEPKEHEYVFVTHHGTFYLGTFTLWPNVPNIEGVDAATRQDWQARLALLRVARREDFHTMLATWRWTV